LSWRNRPKFIITCPKDIDVILFIDESGNSSLKAVKKHLAKGTNLDHGEKMFSICGCVINKNDLSSIKKNILHVKNKHWQDGCFDYKDGKKRVCFHSYEIRKFKTAFNSNFIDRDIFMNDLSDFMESVPTTIITSAIDKVAYCKKYPNGEPIYNQCMTFIIERFAYILRNKNLKGIIMLEARGKEDDKKLLEYLKNVLDCGTGYIGTDMLSRIKGVYFNPKWCKEEKCLKSYYGLEITDLVSYPFYKYYMSGTKDRALLSIENKLYNYPKVKGYGIKKFP